MRGEYKVKHPGLQPLAARARLLVGQLDDVTFQHVRREQNKEADRLSNLGMDEAEAALKAEKDARSAGNRAQPQPRISSDSPPPDDAEHPARPGSLRTVGMKHVRMRSGAQAGREDAVRPQHPHSPAARGWPATNRNRAFLTRRSRTIAQCARHRVRPPGTCPRPRAPSRHNRDPGRARSPAIRSSARHPNSCASDATATPAIPCIVPRHPA